MMTINTLKTLCGLALLTACSSVKYQQTETSWQNEQHRPQLHFSPRSGWMNDPNGMVYLNGTYHLFYQHYPDSTIWGPMHWGHATSKDLLHWEHQPIALFPDSLGYIFSGSAVVDVNNTSGFGKDGKTPIVAIFTHHHSKMEKDGSSRFQNQSIAYSLDEGKTWTKYAENPVVNNPGIRDFRDPKVIWHEESKKWIMALATKDRITFYSSTNLKAWTKESEFGATVGAHGGVWECPELLSLEHEGKEVWVLLVSLNPGGPNGGSGTQYFTGNFDGHRFTPFQTDTRWVDYGPDDYAGVTWSNTGKRKVFLGWMSNWQYAQQVPTQSWRSAMTLPRDLSLEKINDAYFLRSTISLEAKTLEGETSKLENVDVKRLDVSSKMGKLSGPVKLSLKATTLESFSLTLSNSKEQKVIVGFDKSSNQYFIDRGASGKLNFEKGFAAKHTAPRLSNRKDLDMTLIIDYSSIELFADNGLSVMTQVFFPDEIFSTVKMDAPESFKIASLQLTPIKSIYDASLLSAQLR